MIVVALLLAGIFEAHAQLRFITNSGAITITGYGSGGGSSVVIPSSTNGFPVTAIQINAFRGTSISNVLIPDSVTDMGSAAFYGCPLTNVTLGNHLSAIPDGAFGLCRSLKTLIIPDSVTNIGTYAFQEDGLTSVVIGSGVTTIGSSAFSYCSLSGVYFTGNSPTPTNDYSVFSGNPQAKAYYRYGRTGWGDVFDGIPTVFSGFPPAVNISTYSNQPAIFFPTSNGTNFVLQMTTNLNSTNWITVTNGFPISGFVVTNPPPNAFFRLY